MTAVAPAKSNFGNGALLWPKRKPVPMSKVMVSEELSEALDRMTACGLVLEEYSAVGYKYTSPLAYLNGEELPREDIEFSTKDKQLQAMAFPLLGDAKQILQGCGLWDWNDQPRDLLWRMMGMVITEQRKLEWSFALFPFVKLQGQKRLITGEEFNLLKLHTSTWSNAQCTPIIVGIQASSVPKKPITGLRIWYIPPGVGCLDSCVNVLTLSSYMHLFGEEATLVVLCMALFVVAFGRDEVELVRTVDRLCTPGEYLAYCKRGLMLFHQAPLPGLMRRIMADLTQQPDLDADLGRGYEQATHDDLVGHARNVLGNMAIDGLQITAEHLPQVAPYVRD